MSASRYRPYTLENISRSACWPLIPEDLREGIRVVGEVLPFRVNEYVISELIDWSKVPDDPIFRLLFPHRDMLPREQYDAVAAALARGDRNELSSVVKFVRATLNPHPAGQLSHNVPTADGHTLSGLQHKYRETVLFFPSAGQVCHAYCTFCFRWPQFIGDPELKLQAREVSTLADFIRSHPEVTDMLFTGGDPLIMHVHVLSRYVEPLLAPDLEQIQTIRIGTKALTYWPQRFVTDPDADELLRLFERIMAAGKHLAIIAHVNHPTELRTEIVERAIQRVRSTGAVIRVQSPVVRHVNDSADAWAELWRKSVRFGMVPYYMFVERDTGPRSYFEIPLIRALDIFQNAYRRVSGLGRTARGPCMSAFAGKVVIDGVLEEDGERRFLLRYLQARDSAWVNQPFTARYDAEATWFDELYPARDQYRHFFHHVAAGARPDSHAEPSAEFDLGASRAGYRG